MPHCVLKGQLRVSVDAVALRQQSVVSDPELVRRPRQDVRNELAGLHPECALGRKRTTFSRVCRIGKVPYGLSPQIPALNLPWTPILPLAET